MFIQRTDGEHHPRAKLTRAIVDEIRAAFANRGDMPVTKFCDEWAWRCKVSPKYVGEIVRGKTWH